MGRWYRAGALAAASLAGLLAVSCRESPASLSRAPLIDFLAPNQIESMVETRLILFGTGDRSHLRDGWSFDEHNRGLGAYFVWATAPEASLELDVLEVEDKQVLVKLTSSLTPERQHITVLVNDHEVTQFDAGPIFLEYRFVVPAKWLKRGANRLTFRHSSLGTPPHGPKRQLAAAYTAMLLGPECLPLRGFGRAPSPRVARRAKSATEPEALVVTGPATLRRRTAVPPAAIFRARVSLPREAPRAARLVFWVADAGGRTKLLETRLSPRWFGRAATRELAIDLSPWSGKTADLAIEIRPDRCRSSVTTVIVERAGIFPTFAGS